MTGAAQCMLGAAMRNPIAAYDRTRTRLLAAALTASLLVGCGSPPLSVKRETSDVTREAIADNVVATGKLSSETRILLRRHGLTEERSGGEVGVIAHLHDLVATRMGSSNEYFALAELAYNYARSLEKDARAQARMRANLRKHGAVRPAPKFEAEDLAIVAEARQYYLATVLYAFTFLFTDDPEGAVPRIDPRSRIAADLYNRSLAAAFSTGDGYVSFVSGAYPLPFGTLEVQFDQAERVLGNRLMTDFIPSDSFRVQGLNNRYRRPGIGAPLAARTVPINDEDPAGYLVASRAVVSATGVLLFPDSRQQLLKSELEARLIIAPSAEQTPIAYGEHALPLESQPSTALAASLQESDVWRGKFGVFFGRIVRLNDENRLFGWEPRLEGQVPVVFIHGTTSTPAVWANMVNDLQDDPVLRTRYQFLFFAYESGNPILYSSMLLRRSLDQAVQSIDPDGSDACLREMVLVGHSQGGLLAKGVSIDSGTRFWDYFFDEPLEDTDFSPATKAMLKEAAFVEPIPSVDRVVFISTPQRGSFLASSGLVLRLARWLIRMPVDLTALASDVSGIGREESEYRRLSLSTSIDNMSPTHGMIRTLASIPVAPEIKAHSIISVKGEGPYEDGDDGVVKYKSAHIDEVVSEYVVRDSHSTQSNPHTIEEVRRILRLHLDESTCALPAGPVATD